MTIEELSDRLDHERIVPLTTAAWSELAAEFEEVERHATFVAGELLIVRKGPLLAAVEAPSFNERVIRRLDDADAVRRFVTERLDQYERMWDGCGCKVDYYS